MSTYRRALQVVQRQREIIDALNVSDCASFVESTRDEYSDVYIEARAEAGLSAKRATHERWVHAWAPDGERPMSVTFAPDDPRRITPATLPIYAKRADPFLIVCDTCRVTASAVGFDSNYRRLMQIPEVCGLSTLAGKLELHVEHYTDIECPVSVCGK